MKKNLLKSLSFSSSGMIAKTKKIAQKALLLSFLIFIGSHFALAQKLEESAVRQIKSLMDEKASRTPAQKKISSQILYKYKMQKGKRITPEVDSLQTGVEIDLNGKIKVDIVADVTQKLLNSLKKMDCEILYSSAKAKNIVANIPLDKVEQVASLGEVKRINYWYKPLVNNNFSSQFTGNRTDYDFYFSPLNSVEKKKENSFFTSEYAPGFISRAENVKKEISEALKQKEINGTNLNSTIIASAIAQGDVTHKADLARAVFGMNGSGIKIGVISDSYDTRASGLNASDDVASGDLPGPGNPNGFTTPVNVLLDSPGGSDEGRAMLQIIHDLAPGAQLYFATAFVSQANFAQQILDLRAAGCDIIVDDITYFAEAVFQDDDVAQAVNTVTADGAIYFSSAGNSGNKNDGTAGVWEGDFNDSGSSTVGTVILSGGTVHDFGGGVTNNLQTLAGRAPTLNWSDPLGGSGNDYDLYILNNALSSVALALTNVQDGNDDPIEIGFVNVPANFRYVILKKSGAAVRALHLNTNRGRLAVNTPGVTFGHNAAASAYTVAATPAVAPGPYPGVFNSTNSVETFSSDGPRRMFFNPDGTEITPGNLLFGTDGGIALQKPDITAADGVATTLPTGSGLNPFYGTSAAAPHAAAIAGLIKSKLPAITPAQIRTALISSAIDIEAPGADRDAGAGIIMAYEALLAAGATSPNVYIDLGTVNAVEGSYSNGNGSIDPGELASLTVQLLNPSTLNATSLSAVLTSSTSGVTITQGTTGYGNIPAFGNGTNTASPYIFGISSSVECGSSVNFTLTVTFDGAPAPQVFNFKVKIGATPGTITATLGSPPPSGTTYISSSGTQTNRLNRNGIIPTCGVAKATPALQEGVGTLRAYHAYTFLNNLATSQCVTVSVSSASNASIYEVVYGEGGYNPTSIQSNYLADQATTTNSSPFSFDVPANQHFTVVVHEVVAGGGVGLSYNLNVGLSICAATPACTPVVVSPASIPNVSAGTSFSQAFSASGGSGSYQFSLIGTLPAGLSFSGNTLSGTATQLGSFPITVKATDATGCPEGSQDYILNINCPATSVTPPTVTQPTCETPSGTIVINATAGSGSLEYSIDNEATWNASASFSGLVPGSYMVSVRIQEYPTCITAYSGNPVILNSPFSATVADTWTGCVSTSWDVAGNWQDGSVPTATDNVVIPSAPANQPVIEAGTTAVAKSVTVNANALLTLNATGGLTINGSVGNGLINQGTVSNSGSIVIGNTAALTGSGISNTSVFNNNAGSDINIDNTKGSAVTNQGTFTNSAIMNFGASATVDAFGILNYATFNNSSDGEVNIDRVTYQAIQNLSNFSNAGVIRIGAIALSAQDGIYNSNTFTNLAGGEIHINRSWGNGIWNSNAATTNFQNSGKIVIGANANTGISGILNYRVFSNNTGGEIHIDRPSGSGIVNNNPEAVFTNAALIRIGAVGNIAANGIQSSGSGTFNNNTGGEISIDRTGADGINVATSGLFTNNALVKIGIIGSIVGDGIENTSVFSNSSCATIYLSDNLRNSSTFTNSGFFTVNTAQAHTNSALTNNGVIEYPQGNPIPNVTNSDLVIALFSTCDNTPFSPALQIGGANSYVAGSSWYTDPALTQQAGTYDQNTNTFTELNLLPGSTYTLYFSVTDPVNSCSTTVSIKVTVKSLPVVSAGSYGPVCYNSGLVSLGGSPSGGTWSGNGVSGSIGNYTFDPTQGTQTLTYSYTDGNSCSASSQTGITVNPLTVISTDPVDQNIYTFNNASFNVFATGTLPISYQWQVSTNNGVSFSNLSDAGVYSGTGSNILTLTNVPITMNGYRYICVVTGGCSAATSASALLTVTRRPTVLTYTGDYSEQYSDQQTLTAVLKDQLTNTPLSGKTVTFTIGTQSVSATTDASGVATATLILTQSPIPSYTVVTSFAGDIPFAISSDTDGFDILQENAVVEYTGPEFVGEQNSTATTTPILLSASVNDIVDAFTGDITKASVKFYDINSGSDISGWITPGFVTPGDLTKGIVTYNWSAPVPSSGYNSTTVGIKVGTQLPAEANGYYVGSGQTVINVYRSSLNEFITGGGNIIPTDSKGEYASDPSKKVNFGYNIKWNKTMKNLQGNLNLIFRKGDKVYQIKSTAMSGLSIISTNPCSQKAIFTSKANLTDVTSANSSPISIYGGLSLQVTLTDNGESGKTDMIGFTLYNGNNLVYSSSWPSNKTQESFLNGGNLVIHNGVTCTATGTTSVALSSSKNPSVAGDVVTFKATVTGAVTTPTGSIMFKDGTTQLAIVTMSGGTASYSTNALTAGIHQITALYSGDSKFASSITSLSQNVGSAVRNSETAINVTATNSSKFNLEVYPNPTTGPVNFRFTLEESGKATLEIFSVAGTLMDRILEADVEQGIEQTAILSKQLPVGVYIYRLTYGSQVKTGKIIKTGSDQ